MLAVAAQERYRTFVGVRGAGASDLGRRTEVGYPAYAFAGSITAVSQQAAPHTPHSTPLTMHDFLIIQYTPSVSLLCQPVNSGVPSGQHPHTKAKATTRRTLLRKTTKVLLTPCA
jgi:hypothetical protein